MAHRISLFILLIKKKKSIHLANCLMTSAVAIFCFLDMPNDMAYVLTGVCGSLLHIKPCFKFYPIIEF